MGHKERAREERGGTQRSPPRNAPGPTGPLCGGGGWLAPWDPMRRMVYKCIRGGVGAAPFGRKTDVDCSLPEARATGSQLQSVGQRPAHQGAGGTPRREPPIQKKVRRSKYTFATGLAVESNRIFAKAKLRKTPARGWVCPGSPGTATAVT